MDIYNTRMVLAKELKIARVRADLTQVELSKLLGKAQSFVNKYETGERKLEVIEFYIICETLGVNPSDIIKSTGLIKE